MTEERRRLADRRRHPRGGRRPYDRPGNSPLIMVVDSDRGRRGLSEAILAKLQFAVAPVESVDNAVSIAHALRPSAIVCSTADAGVIRGRLKVALPIVEVDAGTAVADALIEIVRAALQSAVM
jgi:hypothetical protein